MKSDSRSLLGRVNAHTKHRYNMKEMTAKQFLQKKDMKKQGHTETKNIYYTQRYLVISRE